MTVRAGEARHSLPDRTRGGIRLRAGAALLLLSILPKVCFWLLPFMGLSIAGIGVGALILIGVNATLLCVGVFLVGRETYRAAKRGGLARAPGELWQMLRTGRTGGERP